MYKIILTVVILLSFNNSFTQDLIKLKSGEFIESKVTEINDNSIKYKKHSNIDGPSYSKKTSEIEYINYENGTKETFSDANSTGEIHTKVPNKKKMASSSVKTNDSPAIILPPENEGQYIGKIQKLNGVDVYCLNTPLIKYSVVYNAGDFISNLSAKTIVTGGLAKDDVKDKMAKLIKAAQKKAEKEGKSIDAVIYSGGKSITAIKYEVSEISSVMYAQISKINGVLIYAFCQPKNTNYEVIKKAKAKSGGLTTMGSYGLVNSTIEDDLMKLAKRLDGTKKRKIDGIIYSTGKDGVGFKFI
jgi:hypothetical protein